MHQRECPPSAQIMQFASSKWVTRPLYVACQLGIADYLKTGPKSCAELAKATGTHEPSLYRLLRGLAGMGIFAEQGTSRRFEQTPTSALLVDEPGSMRAGVLFLNHPDHDKAWSELLYSVQTGKPGFDKAHQAPVFDHFATSECGKLFNDAMTSIATHKILSIIDAYDFSGIRKLVDVGGGHGALLSAVLKKHPKMTGEIYDLPQVIEGTRKRLIDSGLASRCEATGGDFFKSVPSADAIIMSHIIHDWDDERSVTILKNCHKALPTDGKVLIAESIVSPGNDFSPAKLLDLEMLVMATGKERTEQEYADLLKAAGFKFSRLVTTASGASVIEGQKA